MTALGAVAAGVAAVEGSFGLARPVLRGYQDLPDSAGFMEKEYGRAAW